MIRLIVFFLVTTLSFSALANSPKVSIEEYIDTWKDVAIQHMRSHKIPASIILAQGILESGFGNSTLAKRANNHFGIKCHDWKGRKFYQDDDEKDECFRKYADASQSFQDHSEFLTSRSRYASLFELKITDYKGWAKGLKKAGYATNPKYANRLIDIIERYNLDQYDTQHEDLIANNQSKFPTFGRKKKDAAPAKETKAKRTVHVNQDRTKYVIAREHDTFYQIAKDMNLNLRQLNRWNNFHPQKDVLVAGDKVYIMSKKKRSKIKSVQVKENQDLWEISQEFGIQLKALLEKNNFSSPEVALSPGDVIKLR